MYLTQGLQRALQRHPQKTAVRHVAESGEHAITFAELADGAARHAAALQARGVQAGDRVALLAPNNDALITLLWACWWRGAVACPLNTRWSPTELRHALADAGAALLVVDPAMVAAQIDACVRDIGVDAVKIGMLGSPEIAGVVAERLEGLPVRVTQRAHGRPVGGELDYLDEGTLAQALRARKPVS